MQKANEGMELVSGVRHQGNLSHATRGFLKRFLSPLTGLNTRIGLSLAPSRGPGFYMAGADLTGVHVLRDQPAPSQGFYHIGGAGLFPDEFLIRSIGETAERYSQFVGHLKFKGDIRFATATEMKKSGEPIPDPEDFRFFSPEQYAIKGFPFQPFDADRPMSWLKSSSLISAESIWIPAQVIFPGYVLRTEEGEPWLMPAVTTGGAAHTDLAKATLNGLLEAIQVDTAMGHWYSRRTAPRIASGAHSRWVDRLVARHFPKAAPRPQFYYLENPDMPGISVACVIRRTDGKVPATAVGLGIDLHLEESLYKALLEAVGVLQLARITLMNMAIGPDGPGHLNINPHGIFDLDSNVAYFAKPENAGLVDAKFDASATVGPADLPQEPEMSPLEAVRRVTRAYTETGKRLVGWELTTPDLKELGFVASRIWSPDTLLLCLPSAPALAHPRFKKYGGARYVLPHPYP